MKRIPKKLSDEIIQAERMQSNAHLDAIWESSLLGAFPSHRRANRLGSGPAATLLCVFNMPRHTLRERCIFGHAMSFVPPSVQRHSLEIMNSSDTLPVSFFFSAGKRQVSACAFGAPNPRSSHCASWKMMPRVWRCPERIRLTPCRRFTRYTPRVPCTGRWCTANITPSPC